MTTKRENLIDQVRRAVRESDLSANAICRATGIHKSAMSRFLSGERGLLMANLDALADALDLHICKGKPKGKATGKPTGKTKARPGK